MRGDVAIRCQGLGKQYRLGPRQRYRALRDTLPALALAPFRGLRSAIGFGRPTAQGATLWALRDVSFEVSAGEIVGIIGANGAGKSTLLKILSRITEPTEGQAEIVGRVGTLLEVGTGFHPELTGRENVYLSGAILGMKRREIDRRFDEIVAFAEVEPFLETPVKRYSSGMYLRLAFAGDAHLETESAVRPFPSGAHSPSRSSATCSRISGPCRWKSRSEPVTGSRFMTSGIGTMGARGPASREFISSSSSFRRSSCIRTPTGST